MATKRAHTIPAPNWWVTELSLRVQTGRGRRRQDDERMTQVDLVAALAVKYGERGVYHPSEVSRCVLGAVVPLELAAQISELLEIPQPFYIPRSPIEAEAHALAADAPETVLRLARKILAATPEISQPPHPAATKGRAQPAPATESRADRAKRIIMERAGVIQDQLDPDQGAALRSGHGSGETAKAPPAVVIGDDDEYPRSRPRRAGRGRA